MAGLGSNSESIEDHIFDLIVKQSGFSRKKLSPSTRLAQDIGMEGDDAVDFFAEFEKIFQVDLHELHVNWERHFGAEGTTLSMGVIVVLTACGICGFLLERWIRPFHGLLSDLLWAFGLAGICAWIHHRWFALPDSHLPITVADLIQAAQRGKWSMSYQRELFTSHLS